MLRNFAYSAVSAGTAALLLVLMIAAGRVLGEVEFGKFTFALMLGGLFETLMDFGFHQVTIRTVARDRNRAAELLRHTLAIKLVWAAGTLLLLMATATILRPQADVRFACYLIGGSLVFRSYMLTIRGVLQGLERFGWDSIVLILDRGLLLACGVGALWAGTGLRGLTLAFVVARGIAFGITAAFTQFQLGGLGLKYDPAVWRDLHATALPLGFFLIVLNLYQYVDSVMLGAMRTDAETGLYGAAFKIYEGFTYAPLAISSVLTPRLSHLFVRDRIRHRRLFAAGIAGSVGLGIAVGAVAFALATPILVLLFGGDFAAATPAFRILCAGLPIVFAIWILHAAAISVDRERLLLKTGVIGLVVNVALNLYAIPHFGGEGAAFSTVAGEIVSAGILTTGLRGSWSPPAAPRAPAGAR
jgi:PST family polysaccharide transporter